jgi:hypothetical protein
MASGALRLKVFECVQVGAGKGGSALRKWLGTPVSWFLTALSAADSSEVLEVYFRMSLVAIAIIVSLFARGWAISCNVGTNAGLCSPLALGDAADTCFQCVTPEGLSESSGCLSSSTCLSSYRACMTASNFAANFSTCQGSNCNSCGTPSLSSIAQKAFFTFSSLNGVSILSFGTDSRLLCVPRSIFDSTPFPFGSNTSVQSILIWNNADLFAFSSSDCSGASLQPSQIVAVPLSGGSTCYSEFPRANMLPPSSSLFVQKDDASDFAIFLKQVGLFGWSFFVWNVQPFPTPTCQPLSQPPPPLGAVAIIGIFTDYLLPLLLLAFSCRSLLLRTPATRLTLPQFFRLWHCRSGLQSRCAAWFVTSTLIDFFMQLFSNFSALRYDAFLWNWIGIFPTSMVFRPIMASLIFLNPGHFTASVSIVEGCLMTANAYLRLQFLHPLFVAPRIIHIIPPLMFTLSNVVFIITSALPTSHHGLNRTKKITIRICSAIFGDSGPTCRWHNSRVSELVHSVFKRPNATNETNLQPVLIASPSPMSARKMTLLFLAVYWILMCFAFSLSVTGRIRILVVEWNNETYGKWIILACDLLFCTFPVIFCYQLKEVLTKYYGRFVRMSKLCRRGLVPSRLQSASSFHLAVKYVPSEAVRIFFQHLYLHILVWLLTLVIALLVVAAIWLQNSSSRLFGILIKYFVGLFAEPFQYILGMLGNLYFQNFCTIVLLSNLFASSWFSLFRVFRIEHPLLELPKRIASCCCLQFR